MHVRGDMFIFYRNGDPEVRIVPDAFVVFGAVEVPQTSYRVWETGVVPQFVMEVASKSTHLRDRDDKIGTYEGIGVLEYWRFDPTGEPGRWVVGQHLGPSGRYEEIEPGPEGLVRSEVLELDVCEVEGRLRFWDYRRKTFLASHTEERRLRIAAEGRPRVPGAEAARLRKLLAVARANQEAAAANW